MIWDHDCGVDPMLSSIKAEKSQKSTFSKQKRPTHHDDDMRSSPRGFKPSCQRGWAVMRGKEMDRFASENGTGELHSRRSRTVPDCQRTRTRTAFAWGEGGEEGTYRVRATFGDVPSLTCTNFQLFYATLHGTAVLSILLSCSTEHHPARLFLFLRTGGEARLRSTTSVISTPRIPHRVPAYGPKS